MTEIVHPVRAKAGYIETKRFDKNGHVVKAKDHQVASKGMFSGKEMEQVMREVAKDVGASEDQIRIETYEKGQAPMEANPRHRGLGHNYEARPVSQAKERTQRPFIKERRVFSGWSPPTSEEIAAFEAAKTELNGNS